MNIGFNLDNKFLKNKYDSFNKHDLNYYNNFIPALLKAVFIPIITKNTIKHIISRYKFISNQIQLNWGKDISSLEKVLQQFIGYQVNIDFLDKEDYINKITNSVEQLDGYDIQNLWLEFEEFEKC